MIFCEALDNDATHFARSGGRPTSPDVVLSRFPLSFGVHPSADKWQELLVGVNPIVPRWQMSVGNPTPEVGAVGAGAVSAPATLTGGRHPNRTTANKES